jgi:hypothetical protein
VGAVGLGMAAYFRFVFAGVAELPTVRKSNIARDTPESLLESLRSNPSTRQDACICAFKG